MKYGFGYQGSKSSIAEEIINNLPSGERFVDLFGGGFAISHCALLSGKWNKVLYSDIDPLLKPMIENAIEGKYNYQNFIPEWISRETFTKKKYEDGLVKFMWSFANNGRDYMFAKNIEEIKRQGFEWVFHGTPIEGMEELESDSTDYDERRKILTNYVKGKHFRIEPLEHLNRLQQLEHLNRLQQLEHLNRLQQLELTTMDYHYYEYQEGDVVYCDIPYQNCGDGKNDDYGGSFDHGEFYRWAISQPYPVYFSSYKLGNLVWEKDKQLTNSAQTNSIHRREALYCVMN